MAFLIDELYVFKALHSDLIKKGFGFIYLKKEECGIYIDGIMPVVAFNYNREECHIRIVTYPGSERLEATLDKYPLEKI
jgi:hypothetical protein